MLALRKWTNQTGLVVMQLTFIQCESYMECKQFLTFLLFSSFFSS